MMTPSIFAIKYLRMVKKYSANVRKAKKKKFNLWPTQETSDNMIYESILSMDN